MSGPLQLTVGAGSVPAPRPGPGVDPDGPSAPVDAVFGPGADGSSPTGPDRPVSDPLPPLQISFGPGPAAGTPTFGTSTPNGASTSSRPGAGGSNSSDDRPGSDPNPDGPDGNPPGGPPAPRRQRTGRSPRPAAGPGSGSSTAPASTSRLGQVANLLRRGRVTASGSPTGRIVVAKPPRAPRPGRVAGGSLLGGPGSLLTGRGSALTGLLRSGRTSASRLTPETWRVIVILLVGAIFTLGGHIDLAAPAPAQTPAAAAPAGTTTTAQRVLDLAESQVGTVEGRGGGTPYHQAYGIAANQPWCAVFVWDTFRQSGASNLIGPKSAYTPTMANWFRQRGQWSGTPTVGALVFYDWPSDGKHRIQHVGIVKAIGPNTITTLEGNTSSGDGGSQDNGGGVWERTRPRNRSIVGYGLPAYQPGLPR